MDANGDIKRMAKRWGGGFIYGGWGRDIIADLKSVVNRGFEVGLMSAWGTSSSAGVIVDPAWGQG